MYKSSIITEASCPDYAVFKLHSPAVEIGGELLSAECWEFLAVAGSLDTQRGGGCIPETLSD